MHYVRFSKQSKYTFIQYKEEEYSTQETQYTITHDRKLLRLTMTFVLLEDFVLFEFCGCVKIK